MAQLQAQENGVRALSLVWYKVLPANYGGQKAIACFNEALSKYVPLTCLCSKNNKVENVRYSFLPLLPLSKTQFLNPFCWLVVYNTVKKEKISHLILEFPYHGIAATICKRRLKTKFILHTHNIEFLRFKEQGKWWWRLLFYYERWTSRNADCIFFKTNADKQVAISTFNLQEKICNVLPLGVSKPKLLAKNKARATLQQRHKIFESEKILLFAGTLDYKPNADAVTYIFKNLVVALHETGLAYKIIICGRNQNRAYFYLNNLSDDKVIFANEVADIDTYYLGADIFINPVLGGGGVQTKTIEALAYDMNVVCFETKIDGIMEAAEKLFTVPVGNWALFAEATLLALNNKSPTPDSFFMTHDWDAIGKQAFEKIAAL